MWFSAVKPGRFKLVRRPPGTALEWASRQVVASPREIAEVIATIKGNLA